MAINTSTGFEIGAAKPVDDRFVFETIAERNNYNPNLLYEGLLCYVKNPEPGAHYTYKGNGVWQESIGNTSVHRAQNEPTNKDLVWIDTEDEFVVKSPDAVMDEFRNVLRDLTAKVNDIQSRFDHVIDPGKFPDKNEEETPTIFLMSDDMPPLPPGSNLVPPDGDPNPELPENSNIIKVDEPQPNAEHILIKRGYKADLPILNDGELGYCKDTKELYIGANGNLVLINSKSGSTENITTEYIELLSPSKKVYRLSVTDQGLLKIEDMEEANKPDPKPEEAGLFKGLIVNHIYGGGFEGSNNTAVSHGFIELYNSTLNSISLKGLSVHYGQFGQPWRTLNLFGSVPPQTSFLIRCAKHTDAGDGDYLKYEITEYDMEWNIPLTDMGMKVYLSVGRSSPRSENPWASTGDLTNNIKEAGYIDMLAAGGEDVTNTINGYEKSYSFLMNRNTSVRRKDFADTDVNKTDSAAFNFSIATPEQIQTYRPRSLKDGRWDIYFDKTKIDPAKPNKMVLGFGQDAHTTRTFNWQTVRTANQQFVWYRPVGGSNWNQLSADRRSVQYPDVDVYIWSAIARGLTPGQYEYKVGEADNIANAIVSDVHTFTVHAQQDMSQCMKILQITDQQGWNAKEYESWQKAARYILDNEEFDWVLNTGDYSQNGDRRFEWTDYFVGSYDMHKNWPLMGTLGNNDMVRKTESWAYTYYFNTENNASVDGKTIVSCYEWEIGDTWFCCLNSNEDVALQKKWFVERIQATNKRWKVVYTHDAPYTITKLMPDEKPTTQVTGVYRNDSKLFHDFARLFESYGVHLVLCGHKHNYCRSLPVYNTYAVLDATLNKNRVNNEPRRAENATWRNPVWVDRFSPDAQDPERPWIDYNKGVMYCMSNATGYKLKSNKDLPCSDWYYGHVQRDDEEKYPQYTMWTITPDTITVNSYQLRNLKYSDPTDNNGVTYKHQIDTYVLDYKNKQYRDLAYIGQIKTDVDTIDVRADENGVLKIRLTIAPTHDQIVNFALGDDSKIELADSSPSSVSGLINNQITFTPADYYIERQLVINKKTGAGTGAVTLTMTTPNNPDIVATVAPKIVTINVL